LRQLHVEHLERLRGIDREANDKLPAARSALADSQRRLDERRAEAKRLTLAAPMDGVVIPAPRASKAGAHPSRLPTWSGSLLDPHALNAYVEPGTLVCLVGDPDKLTAVLLVDDTDVKRLAPGQNTRLRIDELPGQIIDGRVVDVARHELNNADVAKPARADLSPLLAGLIAPEHRGAVFEARVRFLALPTGGEPDKGTTQLIIGGRGQAKVAAERITLGQRIYRYLAQTFRLPI
jgi:hypothetical protein